MSLKNKKVLYIGLDYFRFPQSIKKEILEQGAIQVDFFPIKKKNIFLTAIQRTIPKLFKKIQDKYHLSILEKVKNTSYDYCFFIQIHFISFKTLNIYKSIFNKASFILYNWDSIKQHNYIPYLNYFDKIYTFDYDDAEKNKNLRYLPLFYTNEFKNLYGQEPLNNNFVLFVGTYNNYIRYKYIKEFKEKADNNDIVFLNYLSIKWTRYLRVIIEDFKILNFKYLKFIAPKILEIINLYERVDIILDVPNNEQSGLTMRVLEALGSGKYLITTNKNIKFENIYNEDSILIYDKNNFDEVLEFVKKRKKVPVLNNIEQYSIKEWVKNIFNN